MFSSLILPERPYMRHQWDDYLHDATIIAYFNFRIRAMLGWWWYTYDWSSVPVLVHVLKSKYFICRLLGNSQANQIGRTFCCEYAMWCDHAEALAFIVDRADHLEAQSNGVQVDLFRAQDMIPISCKRMPSYWRHVNRQCIDAMR